MPNKRNREFAPYPCYRSARCASGRVFPRLLAAVLLLWVTGCGEQRDGSQAPERPLVYEGMPAAELRQTLGEPLKIAPGGTVYDANAEKVKKVEKWEYEKRVVVLIDDTVKSPNMPKPQ